MPFKVQVQHILFLVLIGLVLYWISKKKRNAKKKNKKESDVLPYSIGDNVSLSFRMQGDSAICTESNVESDFLVYGRICQVHDDATASVIWDTLRNISVDAKRAAECTWERGKIEPDIESRYLGSCQHAPSALDEKLPNRIAMNLLKPPQFRVGDNVWYGFRATNQPNLCAEAMGADIQISGRICAINGDGTASVKWDKMSNVTLGKTASQCRWTEKFGDDCNKPITGLESLLPPRIPVAKLRLS